ncbi:hypothetical protein Desaci_3834 [Desulfosporosinus acidiphilus SJ4]|uniref:FlgN protein n=1 Tax=Desulfosporosinus acidiphilus (strain DSM 22704 / JCM 16185 / SJ4) TaxID=646529 RepID=I4DA91_DESAJ|nr:hypothetical protein [Desulfosporosinus acidiphilus]AFM42715.1 hypothetical protein Desaci_3834 [Desulfosporosinus acidiphilus SJ4]
MINNEVNNLCRGICEKLTLNLEGFKQMLELTQQLEAKSPDNEVEPIHEMFEQRQVLINKVDEVNKEINVIHNQIINILNIRSFTLESLESYISDEMYKSLTTIYSQLNNVIVQIEAIDKEYKEKAEMAREAIKLQILRFHSALRKNQMYHKNHKLAPRFVDKKG